MKRSAPVTDKGLNRRAAYRPKKYTHPTESQKKEAVMSRLVVVSNRVASPTETKGSAGGLAVGASAR